MKMNDYRPFGSFPENCTNCLPLEQEISVAAASAFQLGTSYRRDVYSRDNNCPKYEMPGFN